MFAKILAMMLRTKKRKQALVTFPTQRKQSNALISAANFLPPFREGLRESPNVDAPASVTFGPNCFVQSQRSQVLSWLRSDCRASARTIDLLVVHCSATWPSINYTYERLLRDHKARGFGNYPGYHLYIRRDGTLYYCRPVSIAGCHVANFNRHSIGVCYEGGCSDSAGHKPEDNRTAEQLVVMHEVLSLLVEEYPEAKLVGHRDLNGGKKACPCFDVKSYYGYLDPLGPP